jgi:hypothetical protein
MMARSAARRWAVVICVLPFLLGAATAAVHAQSRKPTVKEVAAIRDCAKKHETDLDEVERQCLFNLVGTPCAEKPEGQSNVGAADCYRLGSNFSAACSSSPKTGALAYWSASALGR